MPLLHRSTLLHTYIYLLIGTGAVSKDNLHRCVVLGPERALDRDIAFGFRIMVDVAGKALSPAINDPTTGTLAVDQIEHLLRLLAQRQLNTGIRWDSSGQVRLIYPTLSWEEFVTLAVTEIRVYGAANPQVTRRLQSMYDHLLQVVPEVHKEALHKEAALLQRTIDATFADPADRALAGVADWQGIGGRTSGSGEWLNYQ